MFDPFVELMTKAAAFVPGGKAIGCPCPGEVTGPPVISFRFGAVEEMGATTVLLLALVYPNTAAKDEDVNGKMQLTVGVTSLSEPEAPGPPLAGLNTSQSAGLEEGGAPVLVVFAS
jgi:hypothetical protein